MPIFQASKIQPGVLTDFHYIETRIVYSTYEGSIENEMRFDVWYVSESL